MRFLSAMMLSVLASGCIGFCGDGPDTNAREASLYVTDSAGDPIQALRFTEYGANVNSTCGEITSTQKCNYDILFLSQGSHAITVSADGYAPEVVNLDTTNNDSVHLAVTLRSTAHLERIAEIAAE